MHNGYAFVTVPMSSRELFETPAYAIGHIVERIDRPKNPVELNKTNL